MWLTCHYCGKSLSRLQTLEKHISRYHSHEHTSPSCENRLVDTDHDKNRSYAQNQTGDGYGKNMDVDDEESDGDEDADENNSSNGESDDADDESSVGNDDDDNDNDSDKAFDNILQEARNQLDEEEEPSNEQYKRIFRQLYKKYVLFYKLLRKSETHRKIMATVNEVKERDGDFDFEEALVEGVRLRRKLLDSMVPALEDDDEDDNEE